MNDEQFKRLRAGDTIYALVTIAEFGGSSDPNLCICRAAAGDKLFLRPADISDVHNYHVKPGDCVDYAGGNGSGWGVVESVTTGDGGLRWLMLWRFSERGTAPKIIRESEVKGRKPLPEGYEWPRKPPSP